MSHRHKAWPLLLLLGTALILPGSALADVSSARQRWHEVQKEDTKAADVEEEIRFGRSIAARILGRERLVQNARLSRYVKLIGAGLALHSSRNELQFHFAVLDSDQVNAYSTPGGYIFITRGAVRAARNEDELAAILAHEIAHVTQRHIVEDLNIHGEADDELDLSGVMRILGISADTARVAFNQAVDKALDVLFETGYRVDQELEADRVATLLLAESGYDPTALQRLLIRLDASEVQQAKGRMRTHPGGERRLEELATLLKNEQLTPIDHPRMKARFESHVKTIQQ